MTEPTLEIISTTATVIALAIVIMEALTKFHSKKAERKSIFFTKYLYICQQIEIGVLSMHQLIESDELLSNKDVIGFAKAHMISEDVIKCIYDFEELSISCLKSSDNTNVQKALLFGSKAVTLVENVNAFYQGILIDYSNSNESIDFTTEFTTNKVREIYRKINMTLMDLKDENLTHDKIVIPNKNFREIMQENFTKYSHVGDALHNLYIGFCCIMFLLCLFYIFYINIGI